MAHFKSFFSFNFFPFFLLFVSSRLSLLSFSLLSSSLFSSLLSSLLFSSLFSSLLFSLLFSSLLFRILFSSSLLGKYYFSHTPTSVFSPAWVTSLAQSSSYAFGIVAAIICKRFGCRTTSMCAGIVCGVGLLLSSFASSIYILYFTYGILWGFGTCLLYFSSIIVLTIHCQERLALTSGIVAFGCAIGMLVQGPVIQALFQSLGWAQTLRILALVQVVIITLSGVAFGRQSTEYAQPGEGLKQTSVFDWSVFRNRQFQVWLIALVFFVFTYLIPHAHIVSMKFLGEEREGGYFTRVCSETGSSRCG